MHPKTKAKTKEITKLVLNLIGDGLLTYAAFGSTRAIGKYGKILDSFGSHSCSRVKETIKRLRMLDMIQYTEKDITAPIILTEKGMKRLVKYKLRDLFTRKKKWDYFWRIVFFDIPEDKKYIREQLRRELIQAGFYPFQRSVYVCPFDCENEVLDFCRLYRISHNVLFCVTPSLGREEQKVRDFFFLRSKKDKQ